jgi:hypothetical protein
LGVADEGEDKESQRQKLEYVLRVIEARRRMYGDKGIGAAVEKRVRELLSKLASDEPRED